MPESGKARGPGEDRVGPYAERASFWREKQLSFDSKDEEAMPRGGAGLGL